MTNDTPSIDEPIIGNELIITVAQVAAVLGYSMDKQRRKSSMTKARRWLISTGAGVKRGNRWITTRHKLREQFPEVWEELAMQLVEDE